MIPRDKAAEVLRERLRSVETPPGRWLVFKRFAREPLQDADATRDEDVLLFETVARGGSFALSFQRQVFAQDGSQFPTAGLSVVVPCTPSLEAIERATLFAPGGPPWTDETLRRAQADSSQPLDRAAKAADGWIEQVERHCALQTVASTWS